MTPISAAFLPCTYSAQSLERYPACRLRMLRPPPQAAQMTVLDLLVHRDAEGGEEVEVVEEAAHTRAQSTIMSKAIPEVAEEEDRTLGEDEDAEIMNGYQTRARLPPHNHQKRNQHRSRNSKPPNPRQTPRKAKCASFAPRPSSTLPSRPVTTAPVTSARSACGHYTRPRRVRIAGPSLRT